MLNTMFKFFLNVFPRPFLLRLSYWVRPFLILIYKGKKYEDPIDGRKFRKLLPYGYETQRANALSPSTFSLERHRLLWLYLTNKTDFFEKQRKVLHIAPEQCFLKRFKKMENLDYVSADLYSPLVDVKADICELPFEDATFDLILCNHVLEHIPNDKKAMQELYRVLKKGGKGIFQVPQDLNRKETYEDFSIKTPEERRKHFGQYDHVRVYGTDYANRLRSIGFKVKEVNYTNEFDDSIIEKFALPKGELIPVCYK